MDGTVKTSRIAAAFFLSGGAALIYQIAWQRVLFVALGADMESVTIIVSTFMFGLGVGAAVGGLLADRFPRRILPLFCTAEGCIALYGLISVNLLLWSADRFVAVSRPAAALISFALLAPATVCMGATLPMLIAHAVATSKNVGVSTGTLYLVNTLGAAAGALAVGFFLLSWLDLRQVVASAAGLNLAACAIVGAVWLRR